MNEKTPWHTHPELWHKIKPLAHEMRHQPTPAEALLWTRLRKKQILDVKFRRQHVFERFIVDFYASAVALAIEVDGEIHQYTQVEDALRTEFLEQVFGLHIVRFRNDQVLQHLEAVVMAISHLIQQRRLQPPSQ